MRQPAFSTIEQRRTSFMEKRIQPVILSEAKDLALSPIEFYGTKFSRWFASAGKVPHLKLLGITFQMLRARSFASLGLTGCKRFAENVRHICSKDL
jgi:hypothetical protein